MLGVRLSVTSKEEIRRAVKAAVDNRQKLAMVAVNARKIVRAVEHEETRRLLDTFDVLLADGAAVVKAAQEPVERITGVDLMEDLCAHAADLGLSIFLYGALLVQQPEGPGGAALPAIPISASSVIAADMKTTMSSNRSTPVRRTSSSSPKGHRPRKMDARKTRKKRARMYVLGVGGALDILSGSLVRAPRWIPEPRIRVAVPHGAGTQTFFTAAGAVPV